MTTPIVSIPCKLESLKDFFSQGLSNLFFSFDLKSRFPYWTSIKSSKDQNVLSRFTTEVYLAICAIDFWSPAAIICCLYVPVWTKAFSILQDSITSYAVWLLDRCMSSGRILALISASRPTSECPAIIRQISRPYFLQSVSVTVYRGLYSLISGKRRMKVKRRNTP